MYVCGVSVGFLVFTRRSSEGQVPSGLLLSPRQLADGKQQNLYFPSRPFE